MARIENGEWASVAAVFDGKVTCLYVSGQEVERLEGEDTPFIWLKPDKDGCRVILRTTPEDGDEATPECRGTAKQPVRVVVEDPGYVPPDSGWGCHGVGLG